MQNQVDIGQIIEVQQLLLNHTAAEIKTAVEWWTTSSVKEINSRHPSNPVVIDRHIAHQKGLKKFFTGRQCKRGHVAERWVQNGSCVACTNLNTKPGARARNVVQPPSGLAFPPDIPIELLTPQLVNRVWARILKLARPIMEEEMGKLGFIRAPAEDWSAKLTEEAKRLGWRDAAHVASVHSDRDAYFHGLLVLPKLRQDGDGPKTLPEFSEWLKAGHTHAEAAAAGYIVGWESEDTQP